MPTTGIVLAAGPATRLPNKLLLPIKGGRPLFTSAIHFCRRYCDTVFVVYHDELLPRLCDVNKGIVWWKDYNPTGVGDSLRQLYGLTGNVIITFSDCVYTNDDHELIPCGHATVVDREGDYLRCRGTYWSRHDEGKAFVGYVHVDGKSLGNAFGDCLAKFMLDSHVNPQEAEVAWDLGTRERYEEYWDVF